MTVLSKVVRGSLRVTSFDVGADGKARRSISLMTSADGRRLYFPQDNAPRVPGGRRRRLCTGRHRAALRRGCGRACHYFEAVAMLAAAFFG